MADIAARPVMVAAGPAITAERRTARLAQAAPVIPRVVEEVADTRVAAEAVAADILPVAVITEFVATSVVGVGVAGLAVQVEVKEVKTEARARLNGVPFLF
jgi:hypothetical protein